MRDRIKQSFVILACAFAYIPATAEPVLLTFDSTPAPGACASVDGAPASMQCTADNQFLGVNYGSTPMLEITYLPSGPFVSYRVDDVVNGSTDFGIKGAVSPFEEVVFTPAPGYEVSLTSLNYFKLSATTAPGNSQLYYASNTVVFDVDTPSPGNSNPTLAVNSAYYSGPLTLQWVTGSGALGIDDLALDVRPVPEPATLTMLLAGVGVFAASARWGRRGEN